jgi:hypothetical protein
MVPRQHELQRRYQRKGKLRKLSQRLKTPTLNEAERAAILAKIKAISPRWKPVKV